MEQAATASDIGRRMGVIGLGYSTMLWVAAKEPYSGSRQAILFGIAVLMAGMAAVGFYEFLAGAAHLIA